MRFLPVIALATAVALAGASMPAAAAPVDISSGTGGFIGRPGAGGFSDAYTFTLASVTTVNVVLASVANGNHGLDFSSIVLTGPAGPVNAVPFTPGPFNSYVISGAALTPGSYTLTANGASSAALGTYVGNIALVGSGGTTSSGGGGPLDLSSGSAGFVSTPSAGAFSNTFTFSISTPQAVKLMLASAVGGSQDIDFTNVLLRGPSGDLMAVEFTPDPFEIWTLATPLLDSGNYSIVASGINSAAVATYVGTLALSAIDPTSPGNGVPEPGTGALALAALAALGAGVMVRRRRQKAPEGGSACSR